MGASGGGPAGERVLARSQGDPQPAVRLPCSSHIGVPSLRSPEHASRADSGFVFFLKQQMEIPAVPPRFRTRPVERHMSICCRRELSLTFGSRFTPNCLEPERKHFPIP